MIPAIALISGVLDLLPGLNKLFKGNEKVTAVAEMAADIAHKVTGTTDNDSALEVLKANPDKLVEYQNALFAQEEKFEELYVQDKASARARDVEFLKAGKHNVRAEFLVVIAVLTIFFILVVVIKIDTISEFAKGILTTILGVMLNQLTNVYSFEFGITRQQRDTQSQITTDYIKS